MSTRNSNKQILKLSQKEISNFFDKLDLSKEGQQLPFAPQKKIGDDWITLNDSSKTNNRIVKVSSWQIGQEY